MAPATPARPHYRRVKIQAGPKLATPPPSSASAPSRISPESTTWAHGSTNAGVTLSRSQPSGPCATAGGGPVAGVCVCVRERERDRELGGASGGRRNLSLRACARAIIGRTQAPQGPTRASRWKFLASGRRVAADYLHSSCISWRASPEVLTRPVVAAGQSNALVCCLEEVGG